jgi:uncharacterized protein
MKILYVTDLHGDLDMYKTTEYLAEITKPDIVINGGDMYPKTGKTYQNQLHFLKEMFPKHCDTFEKLQIPYLCMPGNDDLAVFDKLFEKICNNYKFVKSINMKKVKLNNYEFVGFNLVTDSPFGLKDRCRRDTKQFVIGTQKGTAILSTKTGFKKICNLKKYMENMPTLSEEINKITKNISPKNTICIIHMPPANLNLDNCDGKTNVGSRDIMDFILKTQPLITFHGHIHNNLDYSKQWFGYLNKTICVQPGQEISNLAYVTIDTQTLMPQRKIEELKDNRGWLQLLGLNKNNKYDI